DAYRRGLPIALERGTVTMAEIDEAVRRVLTLKDRLGLFDDPYRRGSKPETPVIIEGRRRVAREVATRCIVLLENKHDALPLKAVRRLAVIGPLADARAEMGGPWGAAQEPQSHISVLDGLRNVLGDSAALLTARGVDIHGDKTTGIASAVELCEEAEAIVLCVGEAANMSGEAASRAHLDLPGQQRALAQAIIARAKRLAKPVIVVLFSGRPPVIPWLVEAADAVIAAWFLGSEAGNAIADVLTGRVSPTGRTPMAWPRAVGQIPVFFGERPSGRPASPENHYSSKYIDAPNE